MRMMILVSLLIYAGSVTALSAQSIPEAIAIAEAQGVCGPFGVASAIIDAEGIIQATCNEDVTGFVPLLGGLGPALGLGAIATFAAAIADGNSTPDTQ